MKSLIDDLDSDLSNEMVTLREFYDRELLLECSRLLEEKGIPFEIDDTSPRFDVTFSNDKSRIYYKLNVHLNDLERAREVMAATDAETLKELPSDYYLFGFSNEELKEVIVKANEWSGLDVMLAEKILLERDSETDYNSLKKAQSDYADELDRPDKDDMFMIVLGYILCVMGGILGLGIALILLNSKKKKQNGQTVHRYSESTRKHARNMILLFIAVISLAIPVSLLRI